MSDAERIMRLRMELSLLAGMVNAVALPLAVGGYPDTAELMRKAAERAQQVLDETRA